MATIFLKKEIFNEYGPDFHQKLIKILYLQNVAICTDEEFTTPVKSKFVENLKSNKLHGADIASLYAKAFSDERIHLKFVKTDHNFLKRGQLAESFGNQPPNMIYVTRSIAENFYSQGKVEKAVNASASMSWNNKRTGEVVNLPYGYTLCSLDFLTPILKLLNEGVSPPTDITGKPLGLREFFRWMWKNLAQLNSNLMIIDGYYFSNLRDFESNRSSRSERQAQELKESHLLSLLSSIAQSKNSRVDRIQIIEWVKGGQCLIDEFEKTFETVTNFLVGLKAQFEVEVWGIGKNELENALPSNVNIGIGFVWGNNISVRWHHSSKAMYDSTTPSVHFADTPAGDQIYADVHEIGEALKRINADCHTIYDPQNYYDVEEVWD